MFPRNAKRVTIIIGLVITFLLVSASAPEASPPMADNSVEATTDEPRHTQAVVPFGPYRLIQPPARRLEKESDSDPELPAGASIPQWTDNKYLVKPGDTLSELVAYLKVSVKELAHCSGIANPNRISIGQQLHKPGTCVAPVPVQSNTTPQRTQDIAPLPATGAVENAISFAMAQLGEPYVWGGNGPNVWDCSGLVHYAYRHAGIAISRSTKTLIHEGVSVSRSAMVRGDLIFSSSGHVGIYLGNNEMIHAPHSGDVVKISTLWAFYAARRIA